MTGAHLPAPGLCGTDARQGTAQPGPSADQAMWHDIARHLTAAHGTNPRAIESYAPALGQSEAEHWTAHLTDDATGLIFQHSHHPHSHPGPLPEGQRYRAAGSSAPFPPSPAWQAADRWVSAATGRGPGDRGRRAGAGGRRMSAGYSPDGHGSFGAGAAYLIHLDEPDRHAPHRAVHHRPGRRAGRPRGGPGRPAHTGAAGRRKAWRLAGAEPGTRDREAQLTERGATRRPVCRAETEAGREMRAGL
jgi:hypothetical protein